jgi:hypothetical protein
MRASPKNPVPVMVIGVPPAVVPEFGETDVMVGVDLRYVNPGSETAYPPSSFITITPYTSGEKKRVVLQVIVVSEIVSTSQSIPSPR